MSGINSKYEYVWNPNTNSYEWTTNNSGYNYGGYGSSGDYTNFGNTSAAQSYGSPSSDSRWQTLNNPGNEGNNYSGNLSDNAVQSKMDLNSAQGAGSYMDGIAKIGGALNDTHRNVLDTLEYFGIGGTDEAKRAKQLANLFSEANAQNAAANAEHAGMDNAWTKDLWKLHGYTPNKSDYNSLGDESVNKGTVSGEGDKGPNETWQNIFGTAAGANGGMMRQGLRAAGMNNELSDAISIPADMINPVTGIQRIWKLFS